MPIFKGFGDVPSHIMWNAPNPYQLAKLPALYSTEHLPWNEKIIHEHYFISGCDWYAAEYDPKQRIYFGYAIMNRDFQNAEWGYFSHDELADIRHRGIEVDRDVHWTPIEAGSIDDIVRGMRS